MINVLSLFVHFLEALCTCSSIHTCTARAFLLSIWQRVCSLQEFCVPHIYKMLFNCRQWCMSETTSLYGFIIRPISWCILFVTTNGTKMEYIVQRLQHCTLFGCCQTLKKFRICKESSFASAVECALLKE